MPLDLEPNGATTTPFDDLRCVDCDHLWAEHSRILDDPGLHFVMDNNTAEEVRQHLVGLTAERDALKVEVERLRTELTKVEQRFVERLREGSPPLRADDRAQILDLEYHAERLAQSEAEVKRLEAIIRNARHQLGAA